MEKDTTVSCPCTSNCVRHGDCDACKAHHAGGATKCERIAQQEKGKHSARYAPSIFSFLQLTNPMPNGIIALVRRGVAQW